jgi:hypothetical protein
MGLVRYSDADCMVGGDFLIQSESDNRTSSVIERPFWPITGYSISGRPNSITGHKYGQLTNI